MKKKIYVELTHLAGRFRPSSTWLIGPNCLGRNLMKYSNQHFYSHDKSRSLILFNVCFVHGV